MERERSYVVIAVSERSGRVTVMTDPWPHPQACTIMSKITRRSGRRVQLFDVTGGAEVPPQLLPTSER